MKKGEKVLVGSALGLMVGGPVGALIGAVLGDAIKPAPRNMSKKQKKELDERFGSPYRDCSCGY